MQRKGCISMGKTSDSFPYEDIIALPHHVSKKRPQMPLADRAAQFSPFSALSGYEAAIAEAARLTHAQIELDEDKKAELDRVLRALTDGSAERPEITITYLRPDEKKEGGAYTTMTGRIRKIDDIKRTVIMTDGRELPINQIIEVEEPFTQEQ